MADENPYSSPKHGKTEEVKPSPNKSTFFYLFSGCCVGLLVLVATVLALKTVIRNRVEPDVMPLLLTQLLLANLCLGALLGAFVAWLRASRNRQVTFGSTPHIAGVSWAITVVCTYLFCRPGKHQPVDVNDLMICVAATTVFTYLFAAALVVIRSRPIIVVCKPTMDR